jgi:signal transduction histidine kinase/CheY-like chemotaxis protein/HPt (histidine-containing phosphotransfer) domain-containing protein
MEPSLLFSYFSLGISNKRQKTLKIDLFFHFENYISYFAVDFKKEKIKMKQQSAQNLFERVLFATIALLLVLVVATGWSVYSRLSEVSESPLPSDLLENRRFLTRELNNNILKSDNLSYAYLYQENADALLDFEILESQTKRKLLLLKSFGNNDQVFKNQLRQLDTLVTKRFANLDTLMGIKNERRVNETMQIVANEVEQAALETNLQLQIKQAAGTPSKEESKKKWFQRKDKAKIQEPTVNAADIADQSAKKIANKLSKVRNKAVSKEEYQNSFKYQLEQRNNDLSKKITQLFQQIDLAEKNALLKKTLEAKKVADETNQIIVSFSAISSIFIILIIVLIITLFRKSKRTNQQLQLAKEKSELLTEAKSRFLATMSHEIRTPLNAISGFTEQLFFEKLPAKISDKVGIIQSSVKHLVQITNEILDLSKLEKNEIQFEEIPFNPTQEILVIKDQFQFLLFERNNTLEINLDKSMPNILGDPLRFRQVVINLVSNANKFTKAGKITVTLKQTKIKDQDTMILEIADQGIGIDQNQIDRIFEPFEQADETVSRKYGGTGLGLSITKRIIDAQKGSIHVESVVNKGTKFTIAWPIVIVHDEITESRIPAQTKFEFLAGKTILIADDEPFNRTLLKSLLHPTDVTLLEAENGVKALELIHSHAIDLALLDVRMPEMNGHELVAEIQKTQHEFPIIGLTATLTPEKKEKMVQSGWTDVLTKPIQPEQLKQVIQQVMQENNAKHDEVNLEGLKLLTNNNDEFYNELIDTFIQSTEKGILQIQEALKENNWKQLGELAHQYAAPFKHFEATNCYNTLKEIEQLGKTASNVEIIPDMIQTFISQAQSIIEQIKKNR